MCIRDSDLSELTDYLSEYSSNSDAKKLIKLIDEACLDYGNIATDEDIEAWDIINDMYILSLIHILKQIMLPD